MIATLAHVEAVQHMIAAGDMDEHLGMLAEAINTRHRVKNIEAGALLTVGTHVVLNDLAKDGWQGVHGRIESRGRDGSRLGVLITKLPGGEESIRLRGRSRYITLGATWTLPSKWLSRVHD